MQIELIFKSFKKSTKTLLTIFYSTDPYLGKKSNLLLYLYLSSLEEIHKITQQHNKVAAQGGESCKNDSMNKNRNIIQKSKTNIYIYIRPSSPQSP